MLQLLLLLTSALGTAEAKESPAPFVEVLGIAQDAGHPQAGCLKDCCSAAWADSEKAHRVTSLAIVDPLSNERWILDASPDLPAQLHALDQAMPEVAGQAPSGIFLTHAHIGHYTGLMHLGREAMGAKGVPVYAMPKMRTFLEQSGPWELLVRLGNISLRSLQAEEEVQLNERLSIRPLLVPHRGEYTETVGFVVTGPNKAALYLPDIDKWERWERPIESVIRQVDRAYVDGTFFADGEIQGRSMADIPHPFVQESLQRFSTLPDPERSKIQFIHLNHSNPLLQEASSAQKALAETGMSRASRGERYEL